MPQYHADFWSALVEVIGDTWPEVKPNGIYRAREMARIDWEKQVKQRGFPLCVVDMAPLPSSEWGVANRAEEFTVTFYRIVGPNDADDAIALTEALEAFRSVLWPDDQSNPLARGQVIEYPAISDSMTLPANALFLRSTIPCYAGAVIARMVVGEQG